MATALDVPLNLRAWIDDQRRRTKPASDHRVLSGTSDFVLSVVSGPSQRKDYHVSPFEELFLQIEGDLILRVRDDDGIVRDVTVREGELFALPANIPHSPQRTTGSVGLVVEHRRPSVEDDTLLFYCDRCNNSVFEESFSLQDAADELPDILSRFWEDATLRTCRFCGTVVQPPSRGDTIAPSPAAPRSGIAKPARAAPARNSKAPAKPAAGRRTPVRGR